MTEESRKQQYGRAYVLGVAAQAGVNHAIPDNDFGVDGEFRSVRFDSVRKRYFDESCTIDYQLILLLKIDINVPPSQHPNRF